MAIEQANHSAGDGMETDRPVLVNAGQFAKMLGISPRTLWRLLSAGQLIEPVRIGGSTRWRIDEVRRWIEGGCQAPERESRK